MPDLGQAVWYYHDIGGSPVAIVAWIIRVDSATQVRIVGFDPDGNQVVTDADSTLAPGLYGWAPR